MRIHVDFTFDSYEIRTSGWLFLSRGLLYYCIGISTGIIVSHYDITYQLPTFFEKQLTLDFFEMPMTEYKLPESLSFHGTVSWPENPNQKHT